MVFKNVFTLYNIIGLFFGKLIVRIFANIAHLENPQFTKVKIVIFFNVINRFCIRNHNPFMGLVVVNSNTTHSIRNILKRRSINNQRRRGKRLP